MTRIDLAIRSERVMTPDGVVPACVAVHEGVVIAIDAFDDLPDARTVVQLAADEMLLPGLVDTHVHVNEPGRTHWEGFASATRAAAAGGVTTIIDMPLNSIPPTVDVPALAVKREAAQGQCFVDVGFWGGAVPGNTGVLRPLHDAGVFGFKCFLLHSGVDEFPALGVDEMGRDLAELAGFDALMVVHAEDARIIDEAGAASPSGPSYRDFLGSRPPAAETTAIADVIAAARRTGGRAHVLHLSSADALPLIAAAKADGVRITVETCPHYLTLAAEQIPDGATQFKCCPPIRDEGNRERLWQGLRDGVIDCVVSDHSPSTPDLKRFDTGDFAAAWGGVSSLQLGLAAIWTSARARGIPLEDVVRWMSARPAALAGLRRKGALAVGQDGDLVAFAPEETFEVDPARLHHKNAVTPYAGSTLQGVVRSTWLRGERIDFATPTGRLLTAGEH